MIIASGYCLLWLSLALGQAANAAQPAPADEPEPVLRLNTSGAASTVTSLAFSADGQTLYMAGYDKLVRVYRRDAQGKFHADSASYCRVPINPGLGGVINALAVSPDGRWLAVGGVGYLREETGFRQSGEVAAAQMLSPEMWRQRGTIYLFEMGQAPLAGGRVVRQLVGHEMEVQSLAFAAPYGNKPPLLMSLASKPLPAPSRDLVAELAVWDVNAAQPLNIQRNLAGIATVERTTLTGYHTGAGANQFTLVLADNRGKLRHWDVATRRLGTIEVPENTVAKGLPVFLPPAAAAPARVLLFRNGPAYEWRPPATAAARLPIVPGGVPEAVSLCSSRGDGRLDRAAVIVSRATPSKTEVSLRLQLFDLNDEQAQPQTLELWTVPRSEYFAAPSITADPRGGQLAVSGRPDDSVSILSLADLANPQLVAGAGQAFRVDSFARRDGSFGLLFNTGAAAPASIIFDISGGIASNDIGRWRAVAPPAGTKATAIPLGKRQHETASQTLPALPPLNRPIQALAYWDEEVGSAVLGLYDAATGTRLRRLFGQSSRIRGLCFSDDGRLVAASADDRTTCVWSLLDLADSPRWKNPAARPDERKPLFTLHLRRDPRLPTHRWIAWSPQGPFDASDRAIERDVGWHFNTGQAAAPVRFASLDEYREVYYQQGLLKSLVEHGRYVPLPAAQPDLSLTIEQRDQPLKPDNNQRYVVQKGPLEVTLSVRGIAGDAVERVVWKCAGQQGVLVRNRAFDQVWSAELDGMNWQRGNQTLQVELTTAPPHAKTYVVERLLHVQLPPPAIKISRQPVGETIREAKQRLEGSIDAGAPNEQVQASLKHTHNGHLVKEWPLAAGPLAVDLVCQAGENRFEIVAYHANVPLGDAEQTRWLRTWTLLDPPEIEPPRILHDYEIDSTRPLVVDEPTFRLRGIVEASAGETLSKLELSHQAGSLEAVPLPLVAFRANQDRRYTIDQSFKLSPGVNVILVRAGSGKSRPATATLRIEYRPQPPRITLLPPAARQHTEGHGPAENLLIARLEHPQDRQPYRLELLANDQPPRDVTPSDAAATEVRIIVPLKPGENRAVLRVTNEWQSVVLSEPVTIHYLRPPRKLVLIEPAKHPVVVRQPTLDLVLHVEAPVAVPPDKLFVDDKLRGGATFELVSQDQQIGTWKISCRDVPIDGSHTTLEVSVASADGPCLQSLPIEYRWEKPPPAKPSIALDLPESSPSPEAAARFTVVSQSPLKSVEVWHENRRASVEDASGKLSLTGRIGLSLAPGVNTVRLVVKSGSGEHSLERQISLVPRPAVVHLDSLDGQPVRTSMTVSSGVPLLKGHIDWGGLRYAQGQGRQTVAVHIIVNGFLQVVPLQFVSGQPVGEFAAQIVLNYGSGNRIEIELPGIPEAADGKVDLGDIACAAPKDIATLHLLVVGPRRSQLADVAIAAVQGTRTPSKHDQFETPRYPQGFVYPIEAQNLGLGLLRIERAILRASTVHQRPPNDVVVVYWQGALGTDRTADLATLSESVGKLSAARVLLLDVERDGESSLLPLQLRDTLRLGVLCSQSQSTSLADTPPLLDAVRQSFPMSCNLKRLHVNLEERMTDFDGYIHRSLESLPLGVAGP